MYFSFTTLSTTGFGDLHPRSNAERLLCAILLLFGVMIFTYVKDVFTGILDDVDRISRDLADDERLAKFIGLI